MKLVSCIVLLFAITLPAQQQPGAPAATTTFISQAELVLVPAVVTSRAGAHIPNLKKDDFIVLENGVEQKIALAEEIRTGIQRAQHTPAKPDEFSNVLVGNGPEQRRVTILAVDMINTPFLDQARAREALLEFLSGPLPADEPMALLLVTRDGVRLIHDFTTDPKILAAALRKLRSADNKLAAEPSGEAGPEESPDLSAAEKALLDWEAEARKNFEAMQQRVAAQLTLERLEEIAHAFSGIPARKSLLWASTGFPFSISRDDMSVVPGAAARETLRDIIDQYRRTWKELNQAQIAMYPVDVRGLTNTYYVTPAIGNPSRNLLADSTWRQGETIATFQAFAEATGGRAFYNTNDISGAFRQASQDSAAYYLLAYYRQQTGKPGWRNLTVKVRRDHALVRARSGYFAGHTELSSKAANEELRTALFSPLEYTGIPFVARWMRRSPSKEAGKTRVEYELALAPGVVNADENDRNHILLDFNAQARTPAGAPVAEAGQKVDARLNPDHAEQLKQSGLNYRHALDVPPGKFVVRFFIRDNLTGRIGTVKATLQVE